MTRTENSLKNMKYAIIGQSVALIVSFIARIVFVNTLGSEYLGVNGLFSNILSMISIVEMGIGAAIIYSLYKPLSENNTTEVSILMQFYKKAYNTIGLIILIIGALLTPFLHYLIKDMPSIPHIHTIFIMFVTNSALSYFFVYKRSLIIADQKRYIATTYRYVFFVILNLLQMVILIMTENYILFLSLQILFTLIENIVVSRKANELYPYIQRKVTTKMDASTKSTISKNTRALMGHKFGGIVVNGTDNLLISKFAGLVTVGVYSNYQLIISAITSILSLVFQAVIASVGNLGATGTKEQSYKIFKSLDFICYWIYGLVSICLAFLFNPFISIWIGENYLFDQNIVLVIVISFFLTGMRMGVITFKDALGLFRHDRYKPYFEVIVNLVASVLLVQWIGIAGVFIGTIISTLVTCSWIEPYVVFKHGFNKPVTRYFKRYAMYIIIFLIAGSITGLIVLQIEVGGEIANLLLKALVCLLVPNTIFILLFRKTDEFVHLCTLIKTNTKRISILFKGKVNQ